MRRFTYLLLGLIASGPAVRADDAEYQKTVIPFAKKFCFSCHGGGKTKGDFDFEQMKTESDALKEPAQWNSLVGRVFAHEMPPEGSRQPSIDERRVFVESVRKTLVKKPTDCKQLATDQTQNFYSGHVMSRRLSRAEYDNTVRDLVGIDLKPGQRFPADGSGGEGFDTNGDALFTSAIHIEKFLEAADRVISIAIDGDPEKKIPAKETDAARKRLLIALPSKDLPPKDAAKKIVNAFATNAFRRPVTEAEVDRFLTVFDRAIQRGDKFEAAIKLPLKAILISPNFLFLIEPEPEKEGIYKLGDYPLASRLSYFLWATMPDEELFKLAAEGKLQDDAVLKQQVKRMLRDPRSRGLAENFVAQWLGLRALGVTTKPDLKLFPEFDETLAEAMRREPVLLFDYLLREDRPLTELLNADYTFANESLARIYGMKDVKGGEMRKVNLPTADRGGLITMPGILTATSYPLRTSPVLRGKWVLEELLGSRVPPPPMAFELKEDKSTEGLPLRKKLEMHRQKAECAACHNRMDPIGFGLENFDPIGRYRTKEGELPIDSSGELPGGVKFKGAKELREVLLKKQSEFERNLVRKLLGYALGRQLYSFDDCVIDESMVALKEGNHAPSVLIEKIVLSYPFRYRFAKK